MTAEPTPWPDPPADAADFRPIQYLGGKWRLLEEIESAVAPLLTTARPAVCDLFSGTGVVAARLARRRPVVAADVQEYARVLAAALLRPAALDVSGVLRAARRAFRTLTAPWATALFDYEARCLAGGPDAAESVCDLLEHGSIAAGGWASSISPLSHLLPAAASALATGPYSAMTRHYGGVYFSYRQAAQLDALAATVHALPPGRRDTAVAALLSTASELVSSVGGHFAQPVRPRSATGRIKPGVIAAVARSRQAEAFAVFGRWLARYVRRTPAAHPSTALRADFRAALASLPPDVGCVYADPPYTRDHYSRFYHVLETLALGDEPGLSTMVLGGRTLPSRGLYRQERHQSPFCVVSQAAAAFDALCAPLAARGIPLVLSYSPVPQTEKPRARVMTLDALAARLGRHFVRVELRTVPMIAHAKLNAAQVNAARTYNAEILLIARP
jgi:hypothetical protein